MRESTGKRDEQCFRVVECVCSRCTRLHAEPQNDYECKYCHRKKDSGVPWRRKEGRECATCNSVFRLSWLPKAKTPVDFERAVNATPQAQEKHLQLVQSLEKEDEEDEGNRSERVAKRRRLCDEALAALDTVVQVQKAIRTSK